ncbi:hypothetical protein EG68_09701 [Paragonimus skrjabini miyazakii]|uniref:Uncharacterized protein n=1 Tax=Paragonimus skrjabini miyazakii TaxID=59628 RepID=A0A8S9YGL5_9TREM|nr:hypothetical protein EG68_09701 [Paragonimus skrjabini miyazakii]
MPNVSVVGVLIQAMARKCANDELKQERNLILMLLFKTGYVRCLCDLAPLECFFANPVGSDVSTGTIDFMHFFILSPARIWLKHLRYVYKFRSVN